MKVKSLLLATLLVLGGLVNISLAAPAPPVMSLSTNGLRVDVTWTEVDGALGYNLLYAPSPYVGPQTIVSKDMGAKTSFSADLWEGAAYYVAVQTYNEQGNSGYSNIELFTIFPSEAEDVPEEDVDNSNSCLLESIISDHDSVGGSYIYFHYDENLNNIRTESRNNTGYSSITLTDFDENNRPVLEEATSRQDRSVYQTSTTTYQYNNEGDLIKRTSKSDSDQSNGIIETFYDNVWGKQSEIILTQKPKYNASFLGSKNYMYYTYDNCGNIIRVKSKTSPDYDEYTQRTSNYYTGDCVLEKSTSYSSFDGSKVSDYFYEYNTAGDISRATFISYVNGSVSLRDNIQYKYNDNGCLSQVRGNYSVTTYNYFD